MEVVRSDAGFSEMQDLAPPDPSKKRDDLPHEAKRTELMSCQSALEMLGNPGTGC